MPSCHASTGHPAGRGDDASGDWHEVRHTNAPSWGLDELLVVPLAVFVLALYAIGSAFLRQRDPFHLLLLAGTAGVLGLAVACAEMGVSMSWCLVVLMLAPVVTVLGYETVGHRHLAQAMLAN